MNIEELENQLASLNNEFELKKKMLFREFCFSNNPYKIGEIFEDHIGKILIEKIMFSEFRLGGSLPCCYYYGLELKKDGSLRKDGSKRQASQSNDIKLTIKQS